MNFAIFFHNLWRGRLIGKDAQGNKYFEGRKIARYGKPRRWVVYKGRAEASKVPSDWHGWLHYTQAEPPKPRHPHPWEKDHLPNLTGTPEAYKPKGLRGSVSEKDYVAWTPE